MANKSALILGLIFLAACGGGGGSGGNSGTPGTTAGNGNGPPTSFTPTTALALFAGNLGGAGNVDGNGTAARFTRPIGVATDSTGNIFVADAGNYTIRKVTPAGVVSTLAGQSGVTGSSDGSGTAASFGWVTGIATDSQNTIYVVDSQNCGRNQCIRKITSTGVVSSLPLTWPAGGIYGASPATTFNSPQGIALDSTGNIFVADSGNCVIRKITAAGAVSTFAGTIGNCTGSDGSLSSASFHGPQSLAIDATGNIFVADFYAIRKISAAGVVSTLAGNNAVSGAADGTGVNAGFGYIAGIAIDGAGNISATDYNNKTIRKITPAGVVTTLAGKANYSNYVDATGSAARFFAPTGICVDGSGKIYVAEEQSHTVRKILAGGSVSTFAGTPALGIGAVTPGFESTAGMAVDSTGNLFVTDRWPVIRKITQAAVVSDLIVAYAPYVVSPGGIVIDSSGNVYVSDAWNHIISKITPAGVVNIIAGTSGHSGSSDGPVASALFNQPGGLAMDKSGDLYVADSGNNAIRVISLANGTVRTLAHTAGVHSSPSSSYSPNGFASSTNNIAIDGASNVYVAGAVNCAIQKIAPDGTTTTLAGVAASCGSADGPADQARFNYPHGITTDNSGNIYVADTNNHTIRKIDPAGSVSTIVGVAGQASFTAGPLPGLLAFPMGVTVVGTSLYITLENGVAVAQLP